MRSLRHGAIALLASACAVVPAAQPAFAIDRIFSRVDETGTVNLTNVPDDARYRVIGGGDDAAQTTVPLRRAREPDGTAVGMTVKSAPPASARRALPYEELVAQAAKRNGIDAALLHAVISVESAYNARAVSHAGAAGLMQLMPGTARRFGVADVFDPADNVHAGARYLTGLLRLFDNDVPLALAAYNAGEGAVLRYGRRVPPYSETEQYVPKVIDAYLRLK